MAKGCVWWDLSEGGEVKLINQDSFAAVQFYTLCVCVYNYTVMILELKFVEDTAYSRSVLCFFSMILCACSCIISGKSSEFVNEYNYFCTEFCVQILLI